MAHPQFLPLDSPAAANSSHCMMEPGWGAWRCFESSYAQLVFESADADRYTRTLAPVAVAGEDAFGDHSLAELQAYQVSRSSVSTAHWHLCTTAKTQHEDGHGACLCLVCIAMCLAYGRCLLPVGVSSDGRPWDLQDHRWDAGRPSSLHLQRFVATVGMGGTYDIFFAATPPQSLRLWLEGAQPSDEVSSRGSPVLYGTGSNWLSSKQSKLLV